MTKLFIIAVAVTFASIVADAIPDYFQEMDTIVPHYWSHNLMDNASLETNSGCNFCGDIFYHEPPPDINFLPPPPLPPSIQASLPDTSGVSKSLDDVRCNFCNQFYDGGEQMSNRNSLHNSINDRLTALLVAFILISGIIFIYLISTRRSKIIASLTRSRLCKSAPPVSTGGNQLDKNSSLAESFSNSGVHLSDPCYLQTNRDKNLTSPIISDHVPHKKTAIPSKYWAQPGSIIGRTIRRIPNEYEVPSSRTNSTGTSSAVYGDMNNEANNQRFFSPYNLHTYAEVREVVDPNEHFHTSSNSSVMLSESNYDNAVYSHGSCVLGNGALVTAAPNGSVQMSDFNSMRPVPLNYGQPVNMNHHHQYNTQSKIHHNNGQPMYDQPPQRAQVIITSNNQGVNPTLLNYKDRIHNVI